MGVAAISHTSTLDSASSQQSYWEYYGLGYDPFTPQARQRSFCSFSRWEHYWDLLFYLGRTSNVLLTVTGAADLGKTTFLRHFISHNSESMLHCQLSAKDLLNAEILLQTLARDFVLAPPTGENWEEKLEGLLLQFQYKPTSCLLVIDDAHQLSEEVLQILIQFIKQQSEAQMRLHILLCGEPPLTEKLQVILGQETEQQLWHDIEFIPLNLEETQQYIAHGLQSAGLPAAMPFSAAAIKRIFKESRGIPLQIDILARELLIKQARQPWRQNFIAWLRHHQTFTVGGVLLVLGLVILADILSRGSHYPLLTSTSISKPVNVPLNVTDANDVASGSTISISTIATDNNNWAPFWLSAISNGVFNFTAQFLLPELQANTPLILIPVWHFVAPLTMAANMQLITAKSSKTVTAASVSLLPHKAASHAITTKPIISIGPDGYSVQQSVESAASPTPAEPHHKIIPPRAVRTEPVTTSTRDYTVQLVATSTLADTRAFVAQHRLVDKVNYYRTFNQGHTWYVAVYGRYPTRVAAEQAINRLPVDLRQVRPWVRRVGSLENLGGYGQSHQ